MKCESSQTIELQERINKAFEDFIKVPKEQRADYSKAARSFFDIVTATYFQWFAIAMADKIKENTELLGDAFLNSFQGDENLLRIADKYDGSSSFFNFLHSCVCKRVQGNFEKYKIDLARVGITKAFTDSEERVLQKLLNQQGEEGKLDFWGEHQYRKFCIKQGINPEKWMRVRQIYQKNLEIYAISSEQENENGETYYIIDNDSTNIHNKDKIELEVIDRLLGDLDKLEILLRYLDKHIYGELPPARKAIWPELFTMDYTALQIDTTWHRLKKNNSSSLTRGDVMASYWEEIGLDECREQYGRDKYHFIADWVFAYMIKIRKEVSLAYLSVIHRNCSSAYLSKEKKIMTTRIRNLHDLIYNT